MGELKEIVEIAAVERLFLLLAILGPVVGAFLGALWGARRQNARPAALRGLLIGLAGPLNWLLWRVYNAITDSAGLDTVLNLLLNLALFVVTGLLLGGAVGWFAAKPSQTDPETHAE